MFAIIQTGGKQYKVAEGDVLEIEKIELAEGEKVNFDVLLFCDGDKVVAGNPLVSDHSVEAEVVAHGKGDKIVVFKYKPKKNVRRKQDHRQPFTRVKITSVK